MSKIPVDMGGRICGRWLVLEKGATTAKSRAYHWLCRCSCPAATERVVNGNNLRNGKSTSCGCLTRESSSTRNKGRPPGNLKPGSYGAQTHVLAGYRSQARIRGIEFALTRDEAIGLFSGACHYCGSPPTMVRRGRESPYTLPFIHNGIDRIDSAKGYTLGNCVSCCGACNTAKWNTPYEEFVAWVRRVNDHLNARALLADVA